MKQKAVWMADVSVNEMVGLWDSDVAETMDKTVAADLGSTRGMRRVDGMERH